MYIVLGVPRGYGRLDEDVTYSGPGAVVGRTTCINMRACPALAMRSCRKPRRRQGRLSYVGKVQGLIWLVPGGAGMRQPAVAPLDGSVGDVTGQD